MRKLSYQGLAAVTRGSLVGFYSSQHLETFLGTSDSLNIYGGNYVLCSGTLLSVRTSTDISHVP